jgi:hypothetical protein
LLASGGATYIGSAVPVLLCRAQPTARSELRHVDFVFQPLALARRRALRLSSSRADGRHRTAKRAGEDALRAATGA